MGNGDAQMVRRHLSRMQRDQAAIYWRRSVGTCGAAVESALRGGSLTAPGYWRGAIPLLVAVRLHLRLRAATLVSFTTHRSGRLPTTPSATGELARYTLCREHVAGPATIVSGPSAIDSFQYLE